MNKVLLLLAFIPFFALSQKKSKDTIPIYLTDNLVFTTINNAAFYGVKMKSDDHWMVYAVYPDTTPVLRAFFKDKDLQIKDGPYTVYFPKNRKAKEGFYHNNSMFSVWRDWYENGQLRDSGRFSNDRMVGEWKTYYATGTLAIDCNYADSESDLFLIKDQPNESQSIRNGKFTSWYRNGKIESTGNYIRQALEGEWRWFYENENPSTIENYKNGKLDAITCFDSTGKNTGEICAVSRPALLKHYGDYHQFIYDNLLWPKEAIDKGLEGVVNIRFKIAKDGTLKDLKIEGNQKVFRDVVTDLFKNMTEWDPAVLHNRPIETEEQMEIPFYKNYRRR